MLDAETRQRLARVIAVINRKGGVGKTSITANVGGIVAAAGTRVLIIDLDSQGNLGEDLGYSQTEQDDRGKNLSNAIIDGDEELTPITVRENLDVIPGGHRLQMVSGFLASNAGQIGNSHEQLAQAIAAVADNYGLILIDCPPGDSNIQLQALTAARWLVIPTQPDAGSIQGLVHVAQLIQGVRANNPGLELLGVTLFPVPSNASKIRAEARKTLTGILGDSANVFETSIRQAMAAAVDARSRGQLVFELARDAEQQDPFEFKKALEPGEGRTKKLAGSASPLAADYVNLTREILQTLEARESENN